MDRPEPPAPHPARADDHVEGESRTAVKATPPHAEHVTWAAVEHAADQLANPKRSLLETDAIELAGVHRASPLSIVASALSGLGAIAGLILLVLIRGFVDPNPTELRDTLAFAAALLGISIVSAVITWRTRTWELTDKGLVLSSGLITHKRLVVPYDHIHAINTSSGLFERLLGLITLDLDTGAAETEGATTNIKGLQAGLSRALQAELFRRKAAVAHGITNATSFGVATPQGNGLPYCHQAEGQPSVPEQAAHSEQPDAETTRAEQEAAASPAAPVPPEPLATYRLTRRQLLLAAASQTHIFTQAAAFVILIVQGLNFLHESRLVSLSNVAGSIAALNIAIIVGAVAVLIAVALVVGLVVSLAISLVSWAGFRVQRFPDRITLERGLIERAAHAIAPERIQYLRLDQNLIQQALGYTQVRAVVVSGTGNEENSSTAGGVVLHPFLPVDEVKAFLLQMVPDYATVLPNTVLHPLPRVAWRRQAFRTGLGIIVLTAALATAIYIARQVFFAGNAFTNVASTALTVCAIVIGVIAATRLIIGAILRCRASRIGHGKRHLVIIDGGTRRRTSIIPRRNLQHATQAANPFQARAGVATFSCMTAATGDLALRDIACSDAAELLAWLRPTTAKNNAPQNEL